MVLRTLLILAEGFEEIEAVTPIDVLRRCGVEVVTAGLGGYSVGGAHGITIKADRLLGEIGGETFDAVILPGGPGTRKLRENHDVIEIIRHHEKEGRLIGAICAAPTVLAAAGILKGRRAACFPACEDDLDGAELVREPVVEDGGIITSRGAGTALPFALAIATRLVGAETSDRIARAIVYQD